MSGAAGEIGLAGWASPATGGRSSSGAGMTPALPTPTVGSAGIGTIDASNGVHFVTM